MFQNREEIVAQLQRSPSTTGQLLAPAAVSVRPQTNGQQWFKPYSPVLFLGGACNVFGSLGWAVMACRLLLAVWLVLAM